MARFEAFDAGGRRAARVGLCGRGRDGVYGARDGVDAVEGSGEDERIVGSEVLEAWGEGAVVHLQSGDSRLALWSQTLHWGPHQSAGLVDDQESEDDPAEGVRM